jgi:pimeloyl-ACP methyl ester carboxylesterase
MKRFSRKNPQYLKVFRAVLAHNQIIQVPITQGIKGGCHASKQFVRSATRGLALRLYPTPRQGLAGSSPIEEGGMSFHQDQPIVLALHCSGGGARQWRKLKHHLPEDFALVAPELFGTTATGHWPGSHAFSLGDEAQPILEMIDRHRGPIHLLGHSYGGGVAMHVCAARPDRITSLALYEPSAFHLLPSFGDRGSRAHDEIMEVVIDIREKFVTGAHHDAARRFVDYWDVDGAFSSMKPEHQSDLLRYMPKALLDFHALLTEATTLEAYQRIASPALVMRGEHAPTPTRTIADALLLLLPDAVQIVFKGAGHMGPISHSEIVAEAIAEWTRRGPPEKRILFDTRGTHQLDAQKLAEVPFVEAEVQFSDTPSHCQLHGRSVG